MDSPLSFNNWLKRLRDELDMTQELLAEQVACSVETIRSFESGRRRPSRAMTERLADVLRVPPTQRPEFLRLARAGSDQSPKHAGIEQQAVPSAPPPALSARGGPRPRLPVPPTVLIGREAESAELCRRLADPACRLLTLIGAGGTGKTRLALQVASDLAGRFADGVGFVALAPVMAAEHVAAAIANAFDCPLMPTHTPEESLLLWLRNRELLAVVDNLEHLLEATPLLTAILREAPGVRLLVTSRERLRLQGEWIFELAGLATPPYDTRAEVERSDAVLLFLHRARQHAGDFALTPTNRAAITEICRLLDGMPLGIELAAAWVRVLEPDEIAAEMARSLDFLAFSDRDADPRHRSMRAVIDHSWALLSPDERRVMARLSVFRGGCTREAAAAVAGATLPMLAILLDKSLLRRGAGVALAGPSALRYDLHELVRQYAAAQLTGDDELAALQQVHAQYYVTLAEEAAPHFFGPEQSTWFLRLDQEINNLRAAMRFLLDRSDWERATRLNWALWRFWWVRGYASASRRWAQEVLQHGHTRGGAPSQLNRAQALLVAGSMAWAAGEYIEGFRQCAESVELSQGEADRLTEAVGLMMTGMNSAVLSGDDNHARTHAYLERSSLMFQAIGQNWGAAFALSYLGMIVLERGSYAEALPLLEQGYQLARTTGDAVTTHQVVLNLGLATETQGEHDRATHWFTEGLRLVAVAHDAGNAGYFIKGLAEVAIRQGHVLEGTRLLSAAVAFLEAVGAPIQRHPLAAPIYLAVMAHAQETLGPATFAQAWAEGRVAPLEQALRAAQELAQTMVKQPPPLA